MGRPYIPPVHKGISPSPYNVIPILVSGIAYSIYQKCPSSPSCVSLGAEADSSEDDKQVSKTRNLPSNDFGAHVLVLSDFQEGRACDGGDLPEQSFSFSQDTCHSISKPFRGSLRLVPSDQHRVLAATLGSTSPVILTSGV